MFSAIVVENMENIVVGLQKNYALIPPIVRFICCVTRIFKKKKKKEIIEGKGFFDVSGKSGGKGGGVGLKFFFKMRFK